MSHALKIIIQFIFLKEQGMKDEDYVCNKERYYESREFKFLFQRITRIYINHNVYNYLFVIDERNFNQIIL